MFLYLLWWSVFLNSAYATIISAGTVSLRSSLSFSIIMKYLLTGVILLLHKLVFNRVHQYMCCQLSIPWWKAVKNLLWFHHFSFCTSFQLKHYIHFSLLIMWPVLTTFLMFVNLRSCLCPFLLSPLLFFLKYQACLIFIINQNNWLTRKSNHLSWNVSRCLKKYAGWTFWWLFFPLYLLIKRGRGTTLILLWNTMSSPLHCWLN